MVWDEAAGDAPLTSQPGEYAIQTEDLRYLQAQPECHATLTRIVQEVLAEK